MERHAYHTDRITVRKFLLKSQLLWNQPGPLPSTDFNRAFSILRTLECIQLDPVAAVERNHHLVLHARNQYYKTDHLEQLISTGKAFEYFANAACIIPIEDFAIFEPLRDYYRYHIPIENHPLKPVMDAIMDRLSTEGPLPSRAFKSSTRVRGYWDNEIARTKDTTLALNILFDIGMITIAERKRSEKFFAPTNLHIPEQFLKSAREIGDQAAKEALIDKYMRAYRVFDFGDTRYGWYKTTAQERKNIRDSLLKNGRIIPLHMEGVHTQYYILTEDLDRLEEISRNSSNYAPDEVKFLPPLDNLLWRRPRLKDLFDFNYKWEIYFPESKREYGYYAMPILYGDALIGRMNPKLFPNKKTLTVKLLQLEDHIKIDAMLLNQLKEGLKNFAEFHNAEHIEIEKTSPEHLQEVLKSVID